MTESHVIRIYRRNDVRPERLAGLAAHPESGASEPLGSTFELMRILLACRRMAQNKGAACNIC